MTYLEISLASFLKMYANSRVQSYLILGLLGLFIPPDFQPTGYTEDNQPFYVVQGLTIENNEIVYYEEDISHDDSDDENDNKCITPFRLRMSEYFPIRVKEYRNLLLDFRNLNQFLRE